jgi:ABC-2 type transport system ATP-binding protein
MPPAVLTANLTYSYDDRQALKGVNLEVPQGVMFGILGPNGSGKTTLFRILATLARPEQGTASVAGFDVVTQQSDVRRTLGVVFQSSCLDDKLTVAENLRHHGHLYGCRGQQLKERSTDLLRRLGLQDRANDQVEKLSGGLQRRMELARCLVHNPDILLLDEPTNGLDPTARNEYWKLLSEIREQHDTTVIFTTHWFEEAERTNLLAIMDEGRTVACDKPATLKAELSRDVLTIDCEDPAALAIDISAALSCEAAHVGNSVRIESESVAILLPEIQAKYAAKIHSITASRSTLEDVYVHRTGKTFDATGEL